MADLEVFRAEFQSLSGFLRPCNPTTRRLPTGSWPSFNPYRVFSGLATQKSLVYGQAGVIVSIPIGFSQALQPARSWRAPTCGGRFQSLSGFLRPCNQRSRMGTSGSQKRFNPYRVFSGLATATPAIISRRNGSFQSLSGFLRPCNARAQGVYSP